jgi:adenine phosphoribosyltransferase
MRLMKKLEDLISTYKDFPKEGIDFKDVLEIVQEPEVFNELIQKMSSSQILEKSDAIISIDARGFIFGSAIALQSSKPMIVARKPGKLPGEIVTEKYKLEYGENSLSIQKKSLKKYNSFAIVDDLLATGGTVDCVANLLKRNDKEILGLLTVVELVELKGRSKFNFPVVSSISF